MVQITKDVDAPPIAIITKDKEGVLDRRRVPMPQDIWQHKSGRFYYIRGVSNWGDTPEYPLWIEYSSFHNDLPYGGRADDWHRRMTQVWPREGYWDVAVAYTDDAPRFYVQLDAGDRVGDTVVVTCTIIDTATGKPVSIPVDFAYTDMVCAVVERMNELSRPPVNEEASHG